MFRKIIKIAGIILGVIVVVIAGFFTKAYISVEGRRNAQYTLDVQQVPISTDSAILAHGARLAKAKGCTECHGVDLGGKVFIDDPALGRIVAVNLTKGKGGLSGYTKTDWIRALKHGVNREGKPLLIMPSEEFTLLTEQDMGAIISYCAQVAPVDREFPESSSLGPLGYLLTDLGKLSLFPVEKIDHNRPLVKEVKAEVSLAYGKYLSTSCQGCHRENMKGGDPIAPGFPPVMDISSSGRPGKWNDEQFIATLRSGTTPEGHTLNPAEMPWTMAKEFTDLELKALHLYLNSL
ncbi:cytochrome c [Parachryseolinea silvisoli]|jgi:mono/diheme cytochrome c family protein|uniref:cytochrome c n=1 Tax=Parachryseolinea silvisoli TaxID=2873601 RepID=UPI002265AE95|nr:cytochrome c [Parachryseolinea silvisoli]MCD9015319.1 cytochrome c [Parachryseolinea silvisoli]